MSSGFRTSVEVRVGVLVSANTRLYDLKITDELLLRLPGSAGFFDEATRSIELMRPLVSRLVGMALTLLAASAASFAGEPPSDALRAVPPLTLDAWQGPLNNWEEVASVEIDLKNEKGLAAKPGSGVIYNGPSGRGLNLVTKEEFGDVEVSLEFNIPKGSNSGIKLEGVYEVQIFDSLGVKKLDGGSHGGIYPRAEMLPRYHHIDDGYAPKENASMAPGEWQTLSLTFLAPKFDAAGKKTANAKFVKVVMNGKVIHENLEVPTPTGHVWRLKEKPAGPILLQGDHGPVAFRNIRVRRLP